MQVSPEQQVQRYVCHKKQSNLIEQTLPEGLKTAQSLCKLIFFFLLHTRTESHWMCSGKCLLSTDLITLL